MVSGAVAQASLATLACILTMVVLPIADGSSPSGESSAGDADTVLEVEPSSPACSSAPGDGDGEEIAMGVTNSSGCGSIEISVAEGLVPLEGSRLGHFLTPSAFAPLMSGSLGGLTPGSGDDAFGVAEAMGVANSSGSGSIENPCTSSSGDLLSLLNMGIDSGADAGGDAEAMGVANSSGSGSIENPRDEGHFPGAPLTPFASLSGSLGGLSPGSGVADTNVANTSGVASIEIPCTASSGDLLSLLNLGTDSDFYRMNGSHMGAMYESPPPPEVEPFWRRPRSRSRSRSEARARPRSPLRPVLFTGRFGEGVLVSYRRSDEEEAFNYCMRRMNHIASSGVTYYIGITENPVVRWDTHQSRGLWASFQVLVEAPHSGITSCLEQRLIQHFRGNILCQNVGGGGERSSGGSPHHLYVLIGATGLIRRGR